MTYQETSNSIPEPVAPVMPTYADMQLALAEANRKRDAANLSKRYKLVVVSDYITEVNLALTAEEIVLARNIFVALAEAGRRHPYAPVFSIEEIDQAGNIVAVVVAS